MANRSLEGHVGPGHEDGARAPSGGKAPGASAEHQSPPILHLEDHHIQKLFGKKMPPIGSKIKVHGLIHVGAYSENQDDAGHLDGKPSSGEGNTKRTMALHFHEIKMPSHDGEPGSSTKADQSQNDGMKAAIDKALTKDAGKESAKGKKEGKTPSPRGGQDQDA